MILKLPSLPITTNKSLQIEMLARLVLPAHPPQPYKSIEPNRFAVIPFFPPAANQAESASSRQQANQHTSQHSRNRQKNNGCDIPPREHRESPREHRESQASQTTLNRSRVCFPLNFIVFYWVPSFFIEFHGFSLGFIVFHWVSWSFIILIKFHYFSPSFIVFHSVSWSFIVFHWVSSFFIEFHCFFIEFHRVS